MSTPAVTSSRVSPATSATSGQARVIDTTQSADGSRRADLIETSPPSGTRRYVILYRGGEAAAAADRAVTRAKTDAVVAAMRSGDGATVVRLTQELTEKPWPAFALSHLLAQQAAGYRMLRDFDGMVNAAQRSVAANRTPTSLHTLALALKNAGRIDEAAATMGAAAQLDPKSVEIAIAYAGYLVLSGRAEEGKAKFATVERKRATATQFDANGAWFHAINGDFDAMMKRLASFARLDPQGAFEYSRSEVDFDGYRSEPRFAALVAKLERLTA